jgi:UDP-N-acetylglucosamine--N-acetylmuramyl-(pentapeptide) pyrophosphoryl-undecaprenol N-acetylglucosamine transferase
MRFVIAAGGTGGHLFPGVAVGEVLLARGHEVMLLISEKEIDAIATQGRDEFRIERIAGIGMPRLLSPAIVGFAWRFWRSLRHCKSLLREWAPAAVLGMGGFTSTAPILAGRSRRIPTFVHESNAIPGRANRLNARYVTRVLLGFEECRRHFPSATCEVTGTPIRGALLRPVDKVAALTRFGLKPGRTTLLVMGGSQGAHGINTAVGGALPRLKSYSWQAIHLSGARDEAATRAAYEREGVPASVAAFHHRMEEAYGASDFAIARSGAASLAELSHFGVPAILIPYPFAADDHQTANAQIFERAGAGVLLKESEATSEVLARNISSFLEDPAKLAGMSASCRRLAPEGAAERVADVLLKFSDPNNQSPS